MARHGAPEHDFFLIGGRFSFGDEAAILLDCLPPLLHVRGDTDQASVLHWALQRLAQELQATAPGAALMTRHLGHMMLLQMLRQYLAAQASHPAGWLFALADPRLRAAIEAMHAQPAQRWTLQQLAAVAGQSRSAFALHFKNRVGVTPLDYLLRWRMRLATRRLKDSGAPIAVDCAGAGLRFRQRLQPRLQARHGLLAAPVPAAPRGRAGVKKPAACGFFYVQGACTGGKAATASKANGPRNRPMPNQTPPLRPRRLASSQVAIANKNMKINSIAIATPCHAESPV